MHPQKKIAFLSGHVAPNPGRMKRVVRPERSLHSNHLLLYEFRVAAGMNPLDLHVVVPRLFHDRRRQAGDEGLKVMQSILYHLIDLLLCKSDNRLDNLLP